MTRLVPSSRWLLVTGLVVSALVCCCQGRTAGRVLAGLLEARSAVETHSCCSMGKSEEKPAEHAPGDHKPCDCRVRVTAKSLPDAKPAIQSAGAAPVVLSLAASPTLLEPIPAPARRIDHGAVARPPTSLLRLHCALII